MLLCKQDNISAEMYIVIATTQDTCLAVTMLSYSAMSRSPDQSKHPPDRASTCIQALASQQD